MREQPDGERPAKERPRRFRYGHLVLPGALAAVAIAVNFSLLGKDGLMTGLDAGAADIASLAPRIAAAVVLAAVIQVWLPREGLRRWFGEGRGLSGLALASAVGAVTVGGPFASFPLVAALAASGIEMGMLVAFLTGWSLIGIQRIIVWEWPLMGSDFVLLRLASCIALPVVAGLLMRRLSRR